MAGLSPEKVIEKFAGRTAVVHFKDLAVKPGTNSAVMAPVGSGNLDWASIITASGFSGAEYAAVEQDICEGDPFDALAESFAFLAKKGFADVYENSQRS